MSLKPQRAKPRLAIDPALAALAQDPKTLDAALRDINQRIANSRIELYQPYDKQRVFHAAGASFRERALIAGNQLGKTYSAGAETTYHLTGEYPDWWQGRRFTKPVAWWACGVTSEVTRDTVQRILLGRTEQIGTGMIPKSRIKGTNAARGIAAAIDTAFIHHVSGGVSQVQFKSYEAGRTKFQGETLDGVWLDEEPPADIYSECLTRTNATGGIVYSTFTPLNGMSEVVMQFYPRPNSPDRFMVQMQIEDAGHIDEAQRAKIIASYKAHERDARTRGVPMLGSGAIITVPENVWVMEPFTIPRLWPGVMAIDVGGFDHPGAGSLLRHDPDTDVIYVTNSIALHNQTIKQQAEVLKTWGDYPVAWPHDASSTDRTSGDQIASIYGKHGLDMMMEHATHETGGFGIEASIAELIDRMETGRLKVFSHLAGLRQELRLWHRKDGKVVKAYDDEISALRYGQMMIRHARVSRSGRHAGPLKRKLRLV